MLSGETWDALNVRGCKRTSVLRCRKQVITDAQAFYGKAFNMSVSS